MKTDEAVDPATIDLAATIGRTIERLRRHFPEQPCTQSYCAGRIGVKQQMWSKWESGQNVPSTEYQWRIADLFGVSLDQLCGRDETPRGAAPASAPAGRERAGVPPEPASVPVIGLAASDVADWYHPGTLAVRAPLPPDYVRPGRLFAVVAAGNSMVPDGIRAGYLLYCDPDARLEPGDAVFCKTADGKATIKRFIQQDAERVVLQGWLEPDKTGAQRPYTNRFAPSFVVAVAAVVMVRRKA